MDATRAALGAVPRHTHGATSVAVITGHAAEAAPFERSAEDAECVLRGRRGQAGEQLAAAELRHRRPQLTEVEQTYDAAFQRMLDAEDGPAP